ncbi:unknown [Prevotella sp. CAG:891]|nr:unknown [Prevotella sp. CAG:891]
MLSWRKLPLDGRQVFQVVEDDGQTEVAQVLVGEGFEQAQRGVVRTGFEQIKKRLPVATRFHGQRAHTGKVELQAAAKFGCASGVGKGVNVGGADGILVGHAAAVAFGHGRRNVGQVVVATWRNKVERRGKGVAGAMREFQVELRCLSGSELRKTITALVGSPHHHVAQPGENRGTTLGIGFGALHGVKFAVIVYFKIHLRTGYGASLFVDHRDSGTRCLGIVGRDVDFGIAIGACNHILGSVVSAKHLGVHEHTARGRLVEPSQVQHGFGFAGPEKIPFTVDPGLNPGVIVVGMCPARSVHLTRRNAHGTQGRHGKGGFLAAASCGGAHRGQGRRGARV